MVVILVKNDYVTFHKNHENLTVALVIWYASQAYIYKTCKILSITEFNLEKATCIRLRTLLWSNTHFRRDQLQIDAHMQWHVKPHVYCSADLDAKHVLPTQIGY